MSCNLHNIQWYYYVFIYSWVVLLLHLVYFVAFDKISNEQVFGANSDYRRAGLKEDKNVSLRFGMNREITLT